MKPIIWRKHGLAFDAPAVAWIGSHAQNPTPLLLEDRMRVYCNVRPPPDANGNYCARVAYADLDRENPTRLLTIAEEPIMPLGGRGEFDEFGTMVQSVIRHPNTGDLWMYYVGWTRKVSVPFDWAIGLAISRDGGETFKRQGKGPIIGATQDEPFLHACPHVQREGDLWHLWYGTGIEWQSKEVEPIYRLFHATSKDGQHWQREGQPFLPLVVEDECQTTPTVFRHNGRWTMLFSYRYGTDFRSAERGYRIGCAVSDDLKTWTRNDDLVGLKPSATGWDSEMVAYPAVLQTDDQTLLFYCGNGFGQAGFGIAIAEN
ncbi:glycoside hydrolase family protein [Thiorhodovibrio litoralis]|uniref:hypothetical protein n=1 Tax=Thiorhodovibrio litoralis TaxID=2952932 RepID=UPI002B25C7A3|nr:hypothetical protein [Thiorhodovibrio litoralis]WPL14172.1 hypothetical protein Thiosp_04005 [Thiorhodovibrio litoralis]